MRTFLTSMIAIALAAGGLTAAGVVLPAWQSPALAAKAKPKPSGQSSGKRVENRPVRQTTGFEHQQCSLQNPCSTRNDW